MKHARPGSSCRARCTIGWGLLLLAALAAPAELAAQEVLAAVDRNPAGLEDVITLTVTVVGPRAGRPTLPPLPDFSVTETGTSTQMQIVGGRTTMSVSYTYQLIAERAGRFTVGPVTAEIGGEPHSSRPFQLTVLPAGQEPPQERQLFITASVSDDQPVIGQQVIYTWRLYRRVQLAGASLDPFDFAGFLIEELGEITQEQRSFQGKTYIVHEAKKAIFPQQEGTFSLQGPRLTCEILVQQRRGFFDRQRTERKIVRVPPVEITVRPRPAAPDGYSGLVGRFDISARLSRQQVTVGESTNLTITVSGTGNVQLIAPPQLPELPAFKVYDDQPSVELDRAGGALSGRKVFQRALVPLAAGEQEIPALSLVFFDPEAGSYRTAWTPAMTVEVAPAAAGEELALTESLAPTTGKVAVRILADDILPIHRGLAALAPQRLSGLRLAFWVAALLLPPVAYLGLLAGLSRHRRYAAGSAPRRRRDALRRALATARRLADDQGAGAGGAGADGAGADGAGADGASRCLREYIGDKLGLAGTALTAAEAEARLRHAGVGDRLVTRVHRLLERLEGARYGAPAGDEGDDPSRDELVPLLEELDRDLSRRGAGGRSR